MPSRSRAARCGTSRVGALTAAVLTRDVADLTPEERAAAVAHVERSLGSMPDWTRAGVGAAALVAAGVGRTTRSTRTDGPWVPDPRLPVLGELTRLCRTLGLMGLAEHRAGDAPAGPEAR